MKFEDAAEMLFGLKPEYKLMSDEREPLKAGPNSWHEVTESDFGIEGDFELFDEGTIWIFNPISEAGKQWCYRHLPEDAPRWGEQGYVIEHRYIEDIVKGAEEDGLTDRENYAERQRQEWAAQNEEIER